MALLLFLACVACLWSTGPKGRPDRRESPLSQWDWRLEPHVTCGLVSLREVSCVVSSATRNGTDHFACLCLGNVRSESPSVSGKLANLHLNLMIVRSSRHFFKHATRICKRRIIICLLLPRHSSQTLPTLTSILARVSRTQTPKTSTLSLLLSLPEPNHSIVIAIINHQNCAVHRE